MKSYYTQKTIIGNITIFSDCDAITAVKFGLANCDGEYNCAPVIRLAIQQISEYLNGKRTAFDLPLNPRGTAFQLAVWKVLRSIPYGETCSYKQIAEIVGNPRAYRAVGMANNRNPIPIIIPCHRVIGTDGSLVGYAGGLKIKEQLLALEK